MKEQNHYNEQQAATQPVTPPPFRPSEEVPEVQEPTKPSLGDRIAEMGLDEPTSSRMSELTTGLDSQAVTPELLSTLARGITHDEDVQNADAAGYLRGRNEKIETVMHPQPQDEDEAQATPVFPRYCRRSIWD